MLGTRNRRQSPLKETVLRTNHSSMARQVLTNSYTKGQAQLETPVETEETVP